MVFSNLESWENVNAVTMPRCAFLIIVWIHILVEFISITSPWAVPLSIKHRRLEYILALSACYWAQGPQINGWDSVHCKKLSIRWDVKGRNWFTEYMLWAHSLPWACVPCHDTWTFVYVKQYLWWLTWNKNIKGSTKYLAFIIFTCNCRNIQNLSLITNLRKSAGGENLMLEVQHNKSN